jgi:hypothetical protein
VLVEQIECASKLYHEMQELVGLLVVKLELQVTVTWGC